MSDSRTQLAWDDSGRLVRIETGMTMVPTTGLRWLTSYRYEPVLQQAYMSGGRRIWLNVPSVEEK